MSELLRDHILASAGLLNTTIGGPSVKPYQPKGLWEGATSGRGQLATYVQDHGDALYRRGLYFFIKRTVPPPSKGAWIFGPSSLVVVGTDGTVVYSKQYEANQFDDGYVLLTIPIKSKENEYRLKIKPTTLPDRHQGAGKLAWIFIDEVFVE